MVKKAHRYAAFFDILLVLCYTGRSLKIVARELAVYAPEG